MASSSLAGVAYDSPLGAEIERAEWELASRVPGMDARALRTFTHESAARLFPPASALIEFVRCSRRPVVPAGGDASAVASRPWYAAFVIPSGENAPVRLVDVCAADDIDRLIRSYRATLGRTAATRETPADRMIHFGARQEDTGDDLFRLPVPSASGPASGADGGALGTAAGAPGDPLK